MPKKAATPPVRESISAPESLNSRNKTYEQMLHDAVAEYYDDPLGFTLFAFPWGEPGQLEQYDGPEPEQRQFLDWLGKEIRARRFDGKNAVPAIRGGISSGHGIGKGALTGMLVAFIMSTRPHAKGVVTANTGPQLQDKTWAQITRWVKLCKTAHWFEINTSIMYRKGHRETWKCSPQTCAEENSEAFAGQHNLNSTSFYINDEDCLSADTDVLTRRGWVKVGQLTPADECVTMDQQSGVSEYQPVIALHWAKREGTMLECVGRNGSWRVTQNHKMWAQRRNPRAGTHGPWRLIPAKDLNASDRMTRSIDWQMPDVEAFTIPAFTSARKMYPSRTVRMDAWCTFLGWYFSEGNVVTRRSASSQLEHVAIGISNRDVADICMTADALGLSYRVYDATATVKTVRFHDRALAEYLGQFGRTCLQRRLPGFLRDVSARQMDLFLDAFMAGDGYRKTAKLEILYTSSPWIADGLQELCVKAGWGSTITVRKLKGRVSDLGTHTATSTTDGFVVTRSAERSMLSFPKRGRIHEVPYSGMVYCPTLPKHHLLYTRRNGSCVWVGNSNVPTMIHEVQEGGTTDGEPMWFLFGNPTRRAGYFYDAIFGDKRHRWKGFVFDSEQSRLSNKQQIQEWREDYGEDSDFFRVRVRGLPPNASDAQFIDNQRVLDAQKRQVVVLGDEPLVAGCDLAWGGSDHNVIRFRRGRDARSIPPITVPGQLTRDPGVLTNRLADVLNQRYDGKRISMLFLDSAGIAGAIGSRLRQMGFMNVIEVNFGADSPDPKRRFMRDHMWAEMKDWLLTGAIDKHARLEVDLQAPGLRPDNKQRIWLESKEDIKKRGEKSPDHADALALTFALPIAPVSEKEDEEYRPTTQWG